MLQQFEARNNVDDDGNPAGGTVNGTGLGITWQDGPLGRGDERKEPNGAFVETVIAAALQRLEFYETTKFACRDNALAADYLRYALARLEQRTAYREALGIEGTHAV